MVDACQQNSVIFLVRGGGAERDAGGLGARCRRLGIGWQPDVTAADRCWVEADAGGGRGWSGSGTSRDRVGGRLGARCRRGPRLGLDEMPTTKSPGPGLGPGRDSDDQITGAGGRKINSKESAL